jgi:ATP-binding cassette, subfamily B, bacterial
MPKLPFYQQLDAMDCGPTCLRMIAKYYGKNYSLQSLREKCYLNREGVSLLGISDAAESIGLRSMGVQLTFEQLKSEANLPLIAHWRQDHFVVVHKIKKGHVHVVDPAYGKIIYTEKEFKKQWISNIEDGEDLGIALLLETTPDFYLEKDETHDKAGFGFLLKYIKPYRKYIVQLVLGIVLGSAITMLLPFLFQSIIDFGVNNQDLGFIYIVAIAMFVLIISRSSVDFIRDWILLHLGTRLNISVISDFLIKLMRLPIAFFDTKFVGDLIQRIEDHHRIELFLTSSTLRIMFSFVNIVVLSLVLLVYDVRIFAIFIVGTLLYFLWIFIFMKKRRKLDNKKFAQLSNNRSNIIQLITGMQEIKLNNCEKQKRWEWERIQAALFKINVKSLMVDQNQMAGAILINEIKNLAITLIAAMAVVNQGMSLGALVAIQFIIGQMGSPVEQIIEFFHNTQDAKISLERLNEIHKSKDEVSEDETRISTIPEKRKISISNLHFQYEGPNSNFVLKDINLEIPENKITAFVGTSGSGKTTLIKLLLGFYNPTSGEIKIGDTHLINLNRALWRNKCGAVMQDGFIFSDSIAKNIAIGDEYIDKEKLLHAVQVANIKETIEMLPLAYNTKIGMEGVGLSQGQKQRILIARAVYKNPAFLFFDEATNALDANNELQIMKNLDEFFKGRTVVVVAHRLSTVKNADQIVVLDKGEIVEVGTHEELTLIRGAYYNLVKNQLELGS